MCGVVNVAQQVNGGSKLETKHSQSFGVSELKVKCFL
jgi:hypothetical protein